MALPRTAVDGGLETLSASRNKSRFVRSVHRLADFPAVYSLLRRVMGGERYWGTLVHETAASEPNARVLDLGCGPAGVVRHLAAVQYVGIDRNPRCIRKAQAGRPEFATFVEGDVANAPDIDGPFDVILAMGLLHHLSDADVRATLYWATSLLTPTGQFISADVVAHAHARRSARWLLARDRGDYVRDLRGYRQILESAFEDVTTIVRDDLLRVPLTGAPFPLLVATASPPAVRLRSARDHSHDLTSVPGAEPVAV